MTAQPPDGPPPAPGSGGDPGSSSAGAEVPFDPYRFGPPAHPIDPAYAPPGYVPPPPAPPEPAFGGYGGQQPPGYQSPGYPPAGYPPGYPPAQSYGQAPYGQAPYGQAPYGQAPYGYAQPANLQHGQSNGLAVTALVLGIVALVFSWVPFLDGLVIIPGIVFGIVGINAAKRRGGLGRSMAIIGLCLSVAAAAICVSISAYVAANINCTTSDDGFGSSSSSTHCTLNDNN